MLELMQASPDAFDELKATVSKLLELVKQGSRTIHVDDRHVHVDGVPVPPGTPTVSDLRERLTGHQLAEIRIDKQTSAVDLMHLLHALAIDPDTAGAGYRVAERLRATDVSTITAVSVESEKTRRERQGVRVTDALKAASVLPPEASGAAVVGTTRVSQSAMVRPSRASTSSLAGTIELLDAETLGPALMSRLEAIQHGISSALRSERLEHAIEAIAVLIRKEAEAQTDETRRAFAITVRRVLTPEALSRVAGQLLDDLYRADILVIMQRAGVQGTKVLMERLAKAPTFAERRTYLNAVQQLEEGEDVVASMLEHQEWFVVRNAADLAGELRSEGAIPKLGKALEHRDARVRRSVGIALAKIGTPAAVPFLRKIFRDPETEIRIDVARELAGRGLDGLVMTLLAAVDEEQDPNLQAEYYRALGRIGTAEAVKILERVATEAGSLLGRKPVGPRVAATEGLGLVGTREARAVLQELSGDRAKEVREAAQQALRGSTS